MEILSVDTVVRFHDEELFLLEKAAESFIYTRQAEGFYSEHAQIQN